MGLKATMQTILYSLYRDRVDKRFSQTPVESQPLTPEKILDVQPFHNGAFFSFNDNIRLEVAFLSEQTARLTWSPGRAAPKYAVGGDETIALQVNLTENEQGHQMTAGVLTVVVHPDGRISYFFKDSLIRVDQPPVYHQPAWTTESPLAEEAVILGLGEQTALNLRPGRYHLWNTDPSGSYGPGDEPIYVNIPVYFCQQQAGSYMVFYENSFESLAEFDSSARFTFKDGALRKYIFAGDLPRALVEYSRLTGRAGLPPLWALGFHQCRWGYRTGDEVREVLAGFKQHRLPLDAFHFDIDYMDGYRVFSVDEARFAGFDQLLADMNQDGVHPVVILDPGVMIDPDYGVYMEGLKGDHFIKLPDGKPFRGLVWPGWVHYPDFTRPETRRWWGSYYKRFLEDGVAGFWHDMNEPTSFSAWGSNQLSRNTVFSFEGREGTLDEAHNLYALQMNAAAHSALRNIQPDTRPWMLTRSGWAGIQRYAWKWTGDTESTWQALKMTISTVLGLGISGIPYSGPDIGGFSGNPEAELYIRWFQMSALMAFFRNHAAIHSGLGEPWKYGPEATDICRDMILLRQKLMPYLYTLAWEAYNTGAPVARPLMWVDSGDQRLWQIDDAYLLGSHILVAPVVEEGATEREVFLPEGTWYFFWDGTEYSGGQTVTVPAPLNQIPFFIRGGSIIPLKEDGQVALHIYVPQQEGETVSAFYQDAGEGYSSSRVEQFSLNRRKNRLFIQSRVEGSYAGAEIYQVVFHGGNLVTLRVDEKETEMTPDGLLVEPFENLKIILE
jgi:alpha-glucosidase